MHSFSFVAVFYALAILSIGAAAVTAFSRNLVTAAFALFAMLLGLSGFFVMLGSDFLAVVQVVVYVGGILTLLLFGILLTTRGIGSISGIEETASRLPSILLGMLTVLILALAIGLSSWGAEMTPAVSPAAAYAPKTASIGGLLLSRYLLEFELAGITLLVALLGAAYLVRKRDM